MKFKSLILGSMLALFSFGAGADDYVVIKYETKVFDEPVAKDEYASKNENDGFVNLFPGMAFKKTEKKTGWDVIEYSPGLRGMIMQNMEAGISDLKAPGAGSYKVVNNPKENVSVSVKGDVWTLKSAAKTFSGRNIGNVVVFFDPDVNPAYTLVTMNGKTYVYNYSNALTKFF